MRDAGQRADPVGALVGAERLEEGELHVGPGLDVLGDDVPVAAVVEVVEQGLAVGVARAQAAVVEVHRAVGATRHMPAERKRPKALYSARFCSNRLADHAHRVAAPGHHLVGVLQQFGALFGRERLVHAAGDRAGAMHALAGRHADHFLAVLAQKHALLGDFRMRGDDADHVARGDIGAEAEQQVGRRQVEEVQGVGLQDLAGMHQAADLLGGRRQLLDAEHHVQRLGGGEVVRDRADAAQALHHDRHFPVGAALDEFFEAAEFDDVQAHLMHLVVVVEQDGDLAVALDPRHGIDGDAAQLFGGVAVSSSNFMVGLSSRSAAGRGPSWACGRRAGRSAVSRWRRRRRAAGQEVIHLHHFMDRVHLVQRQRQFRVIGNAAVATGIRSGTPLRGCRAGRGGCAAPAGRR
jgi:hypothetical protein